MDLTSEFASGQNAHPNSRDVRAKEDEISVDSSDMMAKWSLRSSLLFEF